MDLLDKKTDQELIEVLVQESAKAQNELRCAKTDIEKALNRQRFLTMLAHKLINRTGD